MAVKKIIYFKTSRGKDLTLKSYIRKQVSKLNWFLHQNEQITELRQLNTMSKSIFLYSAEKDTTIKICVTT